ncbi:MAG: sensor histidine kinase [Candidatus Eisenbacteria bacterium]|nr:sensor histidine kinase [Candidatus Eisenbacteria bacterium]
MPLRRTFASLIERWRSIIARNEAATEAVAVGLVSSLAIGVCSGMLYVRSLEAVKDELREGLTGIARSASVLVDPEVHQALDDDAALEGSEAYMAALRPLAAFLEVSPEIKFVYTCILRDDAVYFVLDPTPPGDTDGDGIDEKSHLLDRYDDASPALMAALRSGAAQAENEPYQDQWGTFLSAYAPLRDAQGNLYGVLGVDYTVETYQQHLAGMRIALVFGLFVAALISVVLSLGIYQLRAASLRARRGLEEAMEEIRQARDSAESSARAKSEFLANTSHELRTPMHGILSYARFGLREYAEAERDELREYFQNIMDCGSGLLRLLNDLLDLAKLEAGRMNFERSTVSIFEVVNGIRLELEPWARERRVSLEMGPEDEACFAHVDPSRVGQVTRNLLSNAIKFSPEGAAIELSLEPLGDLVVVSVRDYGPGVPEEELRLVFDKFTQSSKTKSGAGGTGLGLAIAREIVQAHGGRIWCENVDGGGAAFRFSLPLTAAPAEVDEDPTSDDRPRAGDQLDDAA